MKKKGVVMQTLSVAEFKANLSSILQQMQDDGEEIVIAYGRGHKKVAKLVPYVEDSGHRIFGQYKGMVEIPKNFDEEDEAINAMFYGND